MSNNNNHTPIPSINEADGLALHKRILAIFAVMLTVTITVLDGSIANLALPHIATDLMATESEAIWIINSYQIAIAICLLPLASFGEVIGYKRIYLTGLILFTLASFACATSSTLTQITLARIIQGLGAAGVLSVNTALIRFIYPNHLLGRAIGYNALVVGGSNALGPTIAGMIMHIASWHWLFLINVPLGLIAIVIGIKTLPMNPLSDRQFDKKSAFCCMLFVGIFLYFIGSLGHLSAWGNIVIAFIASIIALLVLLKIQSKTAPMLPLDLLKIPLFRLSIGTSLGSFAAQTAMIVILPFYLQNDLHMTAPHAGLLLTAWPIASAILAPFVGKISDRISSGLLGSLGLFILVIGLLSLLPLDQSSSDISIALRLMLCGLGFSLFQTPNNRTMISTAPRERTGAASGMLSTTRLAGQTIGASLVALMMTATASSFIGVTLVASLLAGIACCVSYARIKLQQ